MKKNTYDYVVQEVESADPARLIDLLFQRALRDLDGALELWPALPHSPAAIQLAVHAQRIIQELQASLNYQAGGPMAVQFSQLYEYMQFTIMEAVSSRQPDDKLKIEDVRLMMQEIAGAWSQMLGSNAEAQPVGALASGDTLVA
jgi:flagellar secretion chaperone FliS